MSLLVAVDVVWFAHRMACTYSTVKLLLYGHSHAYMECRPVTATGAPPSSTSPRYRLALTSHHIAPHNCINKLHNISATDAEYWAYQCADAAFVRNKGQKNARNTEFRAYNRNGKHF